MLPPPPPPPPPPQLVALWQVKGYNSQQQTAVNAIIVRMVLETKYFNIKFSHI